MLDPHELYQLTDDLPDLGQPVLIQALTGFVDAGNATRLAREHLLTTLERRPIATFDVDQLFDYRSRRPVMIFVEDHWESYDAPDAGAAPAARRRRDRRSCCSPARSRTCSGSGSWPPSPSSIARLDVRLTVGLNAIPMAVPHTRPTGVTAHATRRELIAGYEPWLQRVQVPGSVGHLLEFRLGQQGRDALGFAVHVPHYLAQTEYPAAAEVLLTSVSRSTGLLLPDRGAALGRRGGPGRDRPADRPDRGGRRRWSRPWRSSTTRSPGAGARRTCSPPDAGPLPTADELGAELERFLAEQTRPGDTPGELTRRARAADAAGWGHAPGDLERELGEGPPAPAAGLAGRHRARRRLPAGDQVPGRRLPGRRGRRARLRGGQPQRRPVERGRHPVPGRARRRPRSASPASPASPSRRPGPSRPPAAGCGSGRCTCPTAGRRTTRTTRTSWPGSRRCATRWTPELAGGLPLAVCGDFNVAPTDADVWDPAVFAALHPRHPGRAGGPRRAARPRAAATWCPPR